MTPLRKTALVAGVFYLITFISIPTLFLYGNLKTDRDFITSAGSSTGVLWGALLEVIVALAGIGTAVTLFPVVKRQNEGMALGLRRRSHPRGSHDLHRCREPALARTPATRPRRSGRSGHGLAGHHRRVARRDLQRDVPPRPDPHAVHERAPAGHLDVPIRPRAARAAPDGTHRSPPAPRFHRRGVLRHHRADLRLDGDRDPPDGRCGSSRWVCG